MTATNGWLGKPGVPINPEEPGYHWVKGCDGEDTIVFWRGHGGDTHYENGDLKKLDHWSGHPMWIAQDWVYLAPCLTPDEVQNLRDDLASAERERAHQHGRADRNAAEHAREQARRETLQKRVAELEEALKEAATSVCEWGAYASQYLQDKWDLSGEVARYIAIAEGKNDAAKEGKKDE